ncbi:MAG TPA: hypothetical protein VGP94_07445 [Tepidisphaeraceae bacterium]|nr:hypothetical protein [Tepidisphaeraceae bacterium]
MQKSILFIIVAGIFSVLGFSFARYCPIGAKLGVASAQASSLPSGDPRANSNLISQLQSIRAQLELYKRQHNDTYPEFAKYGWKQLTYRTNSKGQISDQGKELSGSLYGPYFASPPTNPLTRSSDVVVVGSIPDNFKLSATSGFVFEESTGKFFALTPDGKVFDEAPAAADAR